MEGADGGGDIWFPLTPWWVFIVFLNSVLMMFFNTPLAGWKGGHTDSLLCILHCPSLNIYNISVEGMSSLICC